MTPRTSKNPDKIKYVSLVKNRWVYRPFIPVSERGRLKVDKSGFLRPPMRLCHKDAPYHERLTAHARAVKLLLIKADPEIHTIAWFEARYRESDEFGKLAKESRRKALSLNRILKHELDVDGSPLELGLLKPMEITKRVVRTMRLKRLKAYQDRGKKGNVQCNREIAYIRGVLNWADLYYDEVGDNPFAGLDSFDEPVDDRYITDEEYRVQRVLAGEIADYLPVVMDLAYCYAARGIEVTDLEITDVVGMVDRDGKTVSRVRRRKGSKTTNISNRPQVVQAIDAALELHQNRKVVGKYLLPGVSGPKMSKGTIDSSMQRLKHLMQERQIMSRHTFSEHQDENEAPLFFTLHRIKSKAVTDAKDKALAGQSKRMQEHYDKSTQTYEPPSSDVISIDRSKTK